MYVFYFYNSYSYITCTVLCHLHHGVCHQNVRRRHAARSCACGGLCEYLCECLRCDVFADTSTEVVTKVVATVFAIGHRI